MGELARVNGIDAAGVLLAGSKIRVPDPAQSRPAQRYVVRQGDTLSAIAVRYATTVTDIARANGIDPEAPLLAGQALRVTAGVPQRSVAIAASVGQPFAVRAAIDHWSAHYRVDARLARALAWMESGYQPGVVSSAGALGVMQVTPATWDFVETVLLGGLEVPATTDGNIRVGVAFLRYLLDEFNGDERLALAAYYQGARAVRLQGLFAETHRYVENVLALKTRV